MSIAVPTQCANSECRESSIKPIHHSAQKVAIDAVDGPPVFAHHVTYRCTHCGHTWAVQGYSPEGEVAAPARDEHVATKNGGSNSRGW